MERSGVTVFGGTGYLGRRIVAQMRAAGFDVRVAVRRPDRVPAGAGIEPIRADIRDGPSVSAAVAGAAAVINAVSLYHERGDLTFRSIHVEGAGRVAAEAARAGVGPLVHLSGIGADPRSRSPYVRSRGLGEAAVRAAFERAVLLRPSALFGPDDALLGTLIRLAGRAPVIPLFGTGRTRLQPVFVEDVAAAAVQVVSRPRAPEPVYELGGPEILSYRALLERVMQATGRRRPLIPVPFTVWRALAAAMKKLPAPPLTEGQVALMVRDNVAASELPGLADLDIPATGIDTVLPPAGPPR
ncbi:MAG: NAD-dependent epimerase/dehydratase family protein [Alphaproteobacteria bacterium]|jgi:NADH dehydrogenase|nr:NAD-dependent epimerase/dehydratase family protein [Alphaproteobacteria bacterium]